ncbi:hypothetical protein [Gorillibacterium sp. CAU 1737]|uniref:hypothetical protein n=1 Tax=Gorillibacterium sp. CAU 1737 TaxID=3140362 RepID=UPI003260C66F
MDWKGDTRMGTRRRGERGQDAVTCSNCRKYTGKGLLGNHWICRDCQAVPELDPSEG